MNDEKRAAMEAMGYVFGDAEDFLGLNEEEREMVQEALEEAATEDQKKTDRQEQHIKRQIAEKWIGPDGECLCACHRSQGRMKHIVACCRTCPKCQKRIRTYSTWKWHQGICKGGEERPMSNEDRAAAKELAEKHKIPESYARQMLAIGRGESIDDVIEVEPRNAYEFTLILDADDMTVEMADRLYEAGCSDATLARQGGETKLMFDREAKSIIAAVWSAHRDVAKAGYQVIGIRNDEDEKVV